MKIAVIGGTGLIGKKLVNRLSAAGHEVLAASPATYARAVRAQLVGAGVLQRACFCSHIAALRPEACGQEPEG